MFFIVIAGIILNIILAAYIFKPSVMRDSRRFWGKAAIIVSAEASFSVIAMLLLDAPKGAILSVSSVALAVAVSAAVAGVLKLGRFESRRHPENPEEAEEVLIGDEELFKRCCYYMENKRPFLVDALTLSDVASALFTNTLYLSRTINAFSGKNFRRFVNDYRVDYAMNLFRKNMSLKVSELSELSGFHTVVTFNMAFKLVKGVAPSIWCQSERFRAGKVQRKTT